MEEPNAGIHLLAFKAFVNLYLGVIVMRNCCCWKQTMHEIDAASQGMFGFIVLAGLGETFCSWRFEFFHVLHKNSKPEPEEQKQLIADYL